MRVGVVVASLIALLLTIANARNNTVSAESRNELATVSIIPAKHSFKLGEPIAVIVLLEARGGGLYVGNTWSQAGMAIPGFYVDLETAHGEQVQPCRPIVDGRPNEDPDPRTILARNFIFLSSGELIGWRTTIECPPKDRGKYVVRASYSPDRPLNERIADLTEARGRVLLNVLDAKPVEILIR